MAIKDLQFYSQTRHEILKRLAAQSPNTPQFRKLFITAMQNYAAINILSAGGSEEDVLYAWSKIQSLAVFLFRIGIL